MATDAAAIKNWGEVLVMGELAPDLWTKIAKALGEQEFDALEEITTLPGQDYEKDGGRAGFTAVARVRLNRAVNIAS